MNGEQNIVSSDNILNMAPLAPASGSCGLLETGPTGDFQTLTPGDPLARATERILAGSQQDFPVVDNGRVVGILTRHDLIVGLTQHGQDTLVGDTMQLEFETADASEMLETAFRRVQSCQCHTVPVLRRGELVGLVTMDNVGEFVAIQAAEKDFAANGDHVRLQSRREVQYLPE